MQVSGKGHDYLTPIGDSQKSFCSVRQTQKDQIFQLRVLMINGVRSLTIWPSEQVQKFLTANTSNPEYGTNFLTLLY